MFGPEFSPQGDPVFFPTNARGDVMYPGPMGPNGPMPPGFDKYSPQGDPIRYRTNQRGDLTLTIDLPPYEDPHVAAYRANVNGSTSGDESASRPHQNEAQKPTEQAYYPAIETVRDAYLKVIRTLPAPMSLAFVMHYQLQVERLMGIQLAEARAGKRKPAGIGKIWQGFPARSSVGSDQFLAVLISKSIPANQQAAYLAGFGLTMDGAARVSRAYSEGYMKQQAHEAALRALRHAGKTPHVS